MLRVWETSDPHPQEDVSVNTTKMVVTSTSSASIDWFIFAFFLVFDVPVGSNNCNAKGELEGKCPLENH